MAKLTLDTITSSFASTTLFNTNFATILAELDGKVLYRNNTSGEANQMENDLDMNSNSILNANAINTTFLTVNGLPVAGGNVTAAAVTYDDSASFHTATDVQEVLDELGNASIATVQTSATDSTPARLLAVGAFGLGASAIPISTSIDSVRQSSSGVWDAATTGAPESGNGEWEFKTASAINSGTMNAASHENGSRWTRELLSSTWSAWQPVYTGANLNPNVFGGDASNDRVWVGYSVTATVAEFQLPVTAIPASITVTGTFNVRTAFGNTLVASGIVPVLQGSSSDKTAIIRATCAGLITDQILVLDMVSSTSEITVNS